MFRNGKAPNVRDISVGKIYEYLGPEISEGILGFHSFTGCDKTSQFYGKSKTELYKTFSNSHIEDLSAFIHLGQDTNIPSGDVIEGLHRFIIKAYLKQASVRITTIAELRWQMFNKNEKSIENLPPTVETLYCKILRCHYITYILKNSLTSNFYKPDPTLYGWRYSEDKLVPIPSKNKLPAPSNIISLTMCSCKTSNRCKCKKHYLNCTDACRCT